MKNRIFSFLAASVAIVALAGCATGTATPGGETDALEGNWTLVSASDAEGALPLDDETVVTLEFGENVGGTSACNSYFATIIGGPGTIEVSGIGQTEMACMDGNKMEVESRYTAALGASNRAVYEGEELLITGPDIELRFEPSANASLPPADDTPTKDPDTPVTGCDDSTESPEPGYSCPQDASE